MKIKKNIYLFASQVNSSFVINEILQLSETFEKVNVFMLNTDTTNFEFPHNVSITLVSYENYKTSKILKKYALLIFGILFLEFIKSPKIFLKFDSVKLNCSSLLRNFYIADCIAELPFFRKNAVCYSFWFDDWATSLAVLKKQNKITDFASLAHGFDLYEDRTAITHRIAFRWFQLKYVSKVYSVSKKGADYLVLKYPEYADKFKVSYLQSSYKGQNILNPNTINIVTCANFNAVKRIHLVPEILENFTVPVVWHFIGDINFETDEAKKFVTQTQEVVKRNPLVQINIIGKLSNEEVFDFYLNNSISTLLSVSESEGLPVSMMEAISFGIPVISTDVGGCSEIVNEITGMLIPKDFDPKITAKNIIEFLESKKDIAQYRKGVFEFWNQNFSKNKLKFLQKFNLPSAVVNEKQVCNCCIMDNYNDPDLVFDEQGICNHCFNYFNESKKYPTLKEEQEKEFLLQIATIKINGANKKYDAILGVSGGVDSTYLAWLCKKHGLRVLLVHCDNGWNSELSVKNIESICEKTNYDLYTHVLDWASFKDLQLAFIKSGVVDIELPYDYALYVLMFRVARQYGVFSVLSGHNLVTEGTYMPKSWVHSKQDLSNILDIHEKFGTKKLKNYPKIGFIKFLYYQKTIKIKNYKLLNFTEYDKTKVKLFITENMNWRDYGGKHYESIFTRFYQGYILPYRFKIDKRQFHLSTLIQSGQITKTQALEEIKKPIYDEKQLEIDYDYVLKKFDLTRSEFEELMNAPIKKHNDYRNINIFWNRYFKAVFFC